MPLFLYYLPSFNRCLKNIDPNQQHILSRILTTLNAYYASNCDLSKAKQLEPRFFYKQLRKPFYEAGVERNIRIVLIREKSKCFAVMAGNHEQIKTFLNKQ